MPSNIVEKQGRYSDEIIKAHLEKKTQTKSYPSDFVGVTKHFLFQQFYYCALLKQSGGSVWSEMLSFPLLLNAI